MREQILAYALRYQGDWNHIAMAIAHAEPWHSLVYEEQYVTIMDENYPWALRALQYAPWILFYRGDLSLCEKDALSIVGSRNPDTYAIQRCVHIVKLLRNQNVIVSGLAKGIDGIAHHEALSYQTIGVIGCGLDYYYPACNRALQQQMEQTQLVISEYPNGVKPNASHFPWRNRLIAAMGHSLIVVAANKRSGTMLTVNEALTLNRTIYCVPHAMDSTCGDGCNLLISQGANILCDDEDIINI